MILAKQKLKKDDFRKIQNENFIC